VLGVATLCVPRISNEILDKGVRWMPRLKKAMKDVVWRRYASGRCPATFDPEISEWGNPRASYWLLVSGFW